MSTCTPHKRDMHMRTNAKIYIAAVLCLGIGALLASIAADPRLTESGRFIHCLVLAILASTFKIRLPRMQSSISLNFVLFIIAIGALSLTETLVMAVVATIVQRLWRPRTRPKTVQVLFNVAALSISAFAAHTATAQMRTGPALVPGLILAGVVFFVVNTWLVSLVLAFLSGDSALDICRRFHPSSFPYFVPLLVLPYI